MMQDDQLLQQAWEAMNVARKLHPQLQSMLRMFARNNKLILRFDPARSNTDGKTVWVKVPIELGRLPKHDRTVCRKRDENMVQRCEACRTLENITIRLLHEASHVLFDSFEPVPEEERADLLKSAVQAACKEGPDSQRAERIKAGWKEAFGRNQGSFYGLSRHISKFLPVIINAVEDVRVNRNMMRAREGTLPMFEALNYENFANGVQQGDGTRKFWREYPPNLQAIISIYLAGSGMDIEKWLDPEIAQALATDSEFVKLVRQVDRIVSVRQSYGLGFQFLDCLRRLGFCRDEEDDLQGMAPPMPPEPELQPEQQPDQSEEDNDSDSGDESQDQGDNSSRSSDGAEREDSQSDGPQDENTPDGPEESERNDSDQADSGDDPSPEDDSSDGGSDEGVADTDSVPSEVHDGNDSGPEDGSEGSEQEDSEEGGADASGDGSDLQDDSASDADAGGDADPEQGDDAGNGSQPGGDSGGGEGAGDEGSKDELAEPGEQDAAHGGDPSPQADDESGASDPASGAAGNGAESGGNGGDDDPSDPSSGPEIGDKDNPETTEGRIDEQNDTPGGGWQSKWSDYGTADEAEQALNTIGGHEDKNSQDYSWQKEAEQREVEEAIAVALNQSEYFDEPSARLKGLKVRTLGDGEPSAWDKRYGRVVDMAMASSALIAPCLNHLRLVFTDNKRGKKLSDLRKGRVNPRVLGKRVPVDDDRLFQRKLQPGKKDYFVCVGMDLSGSTAGGFSDEDFDYADRGNRSKLHTIKGAVDAKAEVLNRLGVKFAVYGHTGNGGYVEIYEVKAPREPWSTVTRERLRGLQPYSYNMDGHSLEFYRKVTERQNATDRVILYYTDGLINNIGEEWTVFSRNVELCRRAGITVIGVEIGTDSGLTETLGLPTVKLNSVNDIKRVVDFLEKWMAR